VRIALVELIGYREWTESLGHDREWIIQAQQATVYRSLMVGASRYGGFVFPLRYDYLLVVSTGLDRRVHERLLDTARLVSRLPVRMSSFAGPMPREAVLSAQRALQGVEAGELHFEEGDDGVTVLAHVDINDISKRTREEGLPGSLIVIHELVSGIAKLADRYGGIAQYLGGDNVLVLLPDSEYEGFAWEAVEAFDVKVGIGVAVRPREAMKLSSWALHKIRAGEEQGKISVMRSGVG